MSDMSKKRPTINTNTRKIKSVVNDEEEYTEDEELSFPKNTGEFFSQLAYLGRRALRERLINGTASSREILYAAQLDSPRDKLDKEILMLNKDKLRAQTDAINSQIQSSVQSSEVIKALKKYNGISENEVPEDEMDNYYYEEYEYN